MDEENLLHYFCICTKVTWMKETFLLQSSGQRWSGIRRKKKHSPWAGRILTNPMAAGLCPVGDGGQVQAYPGTGLHQQWRKDAPFLWCDAWW